MKDMPYLGLCGVSIVLSGKLLHICLWIAFTDQSKARVAGFRFSEANIKASHTQALAGKFFPSSPNNRA